MLTLLFSNFDSATFRFAGLILTISKSLVIFVSALAGVFFTMIWQSIRTVSSMRIYRESSRKILELEEELKKKEQIISEMKDKPDGNQEKG
jgi:hypothetical protein